MRSVVFLVQILLGALAYDWASLNLPEPHLPFYFSNHPDLETLCAQDESCPYKEHLNTGRCFGYEKDCKESDQYMTVRCPDKDEWVPKKEKQIQKFWDTGDFGIISNKLSHMRTLCSSERQGGAFLECEQHARYCRGKNIVMDLREVKRTKRYDVDFLKAGAFGGDCKLDKTIQSKEWDKTHANSLQSWYHIVEQFTSIPDHDATQCDVVIDKPTYIIQNDAVVNMFHHFCDFVNLYVTQHLNHTTFDMDSQIIIWDTSGMKFSDPFDTAWEAFTQNPVSGIGEYIGKRVCFKNVILALPPRQRLGLFYNMPLVSGCEGTGLFRAYNEHTIHRLGIKQQGPQKDKIRITILSRGSKYRNILNQQELLDALNKNPKYEAKIVEYKFAREDHVENFRRQIETSHNSDIFIGMHGAGLTHLLFLPHWAAVMEIYHCDDPRCYSTLARLRGVKYFTWTKMDKLHQQDEGHHPQLGAHKKFTNYSFDVDEFLRLISLAADHVTHHKEFRAARRKMYKEEVKDEL